MSIPLTTNAMPVDGLAWLSEWEMPFESAYTLMQKCAWANGVGAQDLCHTIFGRNMLNSENIGRHGRSLLEMPWAAVRDHPGVSYLRDKAVEGALTSRAGRWTPFIAADGVFRHCRACLSHGFQSALYQIDGLTTCPIHHQPIAVGCSYCGASAPRYAMTEDGFSLPFHCPNCLAPLAGTFDPGTWSDPAFRHRVLTALSPLAHWLQQLAASSLQWVNWNEWQLPLRWHCSEEERRIAALDVLLKVYPPPKELDVLRPSKHAPQVYVGAIDQEQSQTLFHREYPLSQEQLTERVGLYKAIRRHVTRQLRGCGKVTIQHLPNMIRLSSQSDGAMALSTSACPRLQALLLWRFHFEQAQADPHVLVLRPAVLTWPTDCAVDASAWASYLLASFHAAVGVFDAWRNEAIRLEDADLYGHDKPNARALHARYAPLLAPARLPQFPAVCTLTAWDAEARRRLLVIGPPNIASCVAAPEHDGRLWCACRGQRQCMPGCDTVVQKPIGLGPVPQEVRQPRPDVNLAYFVPMEQLSLPSTLDGSALRPEFNRNQCRLSAANDLEAISLWLSDFTLPATRKTYRQQIEKVLVWCVAQRGIALSQMSCDDVTAYSTFLQQLQPRDVWLPAHTTGATQRWSPFRKAPSAATQDHILRVLSLLFDHWSDRKFILRNPCKMDRWGLYMQNHRTARVAAAPSQESRNAQLTIQEWSYLTHAAGSPIEHITDWLPLGLAYYACVKPTEMAAIRINALQRSPSPRPGVDIWSILIPTRPAARQQVFLLAPLATLFMSLFPASPGDFSAYQAAHGAEFLFDLPALMPDKRGTKRTGPPTGQALSSRLKPVFEGAAVVAERYGDAIGAERLRHATLSWATHAIETHLEQKNARGAACWEVLGAYTLCPDATRMWPS